MNEAGEFNRFLDDLRADRSHGAGELARDCLRVAAEIAEQVVAQDVMELREVLRRRAEAMQRARPSMAPIENLLGRWRKALEKSRSDDLERIRRLAGAAARNLIHESRLAAARAAAAALEYIGAERILITHSLSSTVLEYFRRRQGPGRRAQVIVSESRPLFEGRRLAERLSEWSIPVTLITDAQLGLFAPQADVALVGADSVLADGSTVNKAGTYLLALAAKDHGVPFYVCCESFKWRRDRRFELEEMEASELGAPDWPGVTARNVYFDVTPASLISGWFSEAGLCTVAPASGRPFSRAART